MDHGQFRLKWGTGCARLVPPHCLPQSGLFVANVRPRRKPGWDSKVLAEMKANIYAQLREIPGTPGFEAPTSSGRRLVQPWKPIASIQRCGRPTCRMR